MKITKHAQSCFLIETDKGSRVLIDPGRYVFADKEKALNTDVDFKNIDILIITHEHSDHFNEDTIDIIKREKPVIFTTVKVAGMITEETLQECKLLPESVSIGPLGKGKDIFITGVDSTHGPLPTGKPAPHVDGAMVDDGKNQFYTPGDTVFIKDIGADILAAPISGTVTTTATEALDQISKFVIEPKLVIPMHYDSEKFPDDSDEFVAKAQEAGLNVKKLQNGETIEV
jgi:L-ascorbate metabolism protein UlaG (beta-lactamase superfamily)